MEEDIKILEEFAHDLMQDYIYSPDEIPQCDRRLKQAIENLIQRFKVLKAEYKREQYRNELLEEDIREYKNNYIPKSKVKQIIERYKNTDMEDYYKILEFYESVLSLLED